MEILIGIILSAASGFFIYESTNDPDMGIAVALGLATLCLLAAYIADSIAIAIIRLKKKK